MGHIVEDTNIYWELESFVITVHISTSNEGRHLLRPVVLTYLGLLWSGIYCRGDTYYRG